MNPSETREFVTEAFDYLNKLEECSINHAVNRDLLEYIANGFVKYDTCENFIDHIDEWIRSIVNVFPELGFDHKTNQIRATIDLEDQLVIMDNNLRDDLEDIIHIQSKFGFIVEYKSKSKGFKYRTPLSQFFEYIQKQFPVITDRYKGLGSSEAKASKEVIMDPKTRRIIRITMNDATAYKQMGVLVGKSKDEVNERKELLMNFRFTMDMIDN